MMGGDAPSDDEAENERIQKKRAKNKAKDSEDDYGDSDDDSEVRESDGSAEQAKLEQLGASSSEDEAMQVDEESLASDQFMK